jgi:hypothetical protein
MSKTRVAIGLAMVLAMGAVGPLQAQQNPIARQQPKGLGVTPTFEGWYQNPDGTYTLSFGYLNRNTVEELTVPVGARNSVSPGLVDQGQPTYFTPGRSYGVFAVTVPADFGPQDRVTWTLEANGEKWAIPGGLLAAYETANLYAKATDEKPPVLVLSDEGTESRGPNGARIGPIVHRMGRPLTLTVAAWDEYQGEEVTVRWYKYRGPGEVTFNPQEVPIVENDLQNELSRFGPEGAVLLGTASASFSQPGDYVLYVRADHSDVRVSAAGLEQCCWTNGYVSVTVTAGEGGQQ